MNLDDIGHAAPLTNRIHVRSMGTNTQCCRTRSMTQNSTAPPPHSKPYSQPAIRKLKARREHEQSHFARSQIQPLLHIAFIYPFVVQKEARSDLMMMMGVLVRFPFVVCLFVFCFCFLWADCSRLWSPPISGFKAHALSRLCCLSLGVGGVGKGEGGTWTI